MFTLKPATFFVMEVKSFLDYKIEYSSDFFNAIIKLQLSDLFHSLNEMSYLLATCFLLFKLCYLSVISWSSVKLMCLFAFDD